MTPSPAPSTFVDLVLAGEALHDEIDDYVDAWHAGPREQSLHEFLGMSDVEYALWVERPEAIRAIFHSRHFGVPLPAALARLDDPRVRKPDGSVDKELTAWIENRRKGRA